MLLSYYTILPFILLIAAIAILPLALPEFWEKNSRKALVTAVISLPILVFLALHSTHELILTAKDYFSFIALLTALFVISGGILITGDLRGTPSVNTLFLFAGALVANLIGTTGASMLIIRPLLSTNSERKLTIHIPVFFIFIVSNIGGCLTPLADPPLFLGYLKGVPFSWTFRLFPAWLFAVATLLAVFYAMDRYYFSRETKRDVQFDRTHLAPLRVHGKLNFIFLAGVVGAIFFQLPFGYREAVMLSMAAASFFTTPRRLHEKNRFTFNPIVEVAILFAGIFVTLVPAMMLLQAYGGRLGIASPWQFFWLTGILSSFLDNAPTYLAFFSLAQSVTVPGAHEVVAGVGDHLLRAISCGAVFMGANTYIGNGPNFMVKIIAEEHKFPIPHFFGYMVYSALILIPLYLAITFIFFL